MSSDTFKKVFTPQQLEYVCKFSKLSHQKRKNQKTNFPKLNEFPIPDVLIEIIQEYILQHHECGALTNVSRNNRNKLIKKEDVIMDLLPCFSNFLNKIQSYITSYE